MTGAQQLSSVGEINAGMQRGAGVYFMPSGGMDAFRRAVDK
jgi:hypothetical protein